MSARLGLLNEALETYWAIRQEAFQEILTYLQGDYNPERLAQTMHPQDFQKYLINGQFNPEAIQGKSDAYLPNAYRTEQRDNVAIIPIRGPIFPRANLLTMSGGTSVTSLAHDFTLALENDQIDTIIHNVDSPGGEITGIGEYAQMIARARATSGKKIISYVYGQGASAAFWILSRSSKVYLAQTAQVGSIGVVAGYTLREKADEKSGIQRIEIVSSQSPKKRMSPATPEGKEHIQKMVNDLADIFIASVAESRGVTAEEVISNFGSGGMVLASEAVKVGMVDSISTLEEVIAEHIHSNSIYGGFMEITVAQVKAEAPEVYQAILDEGKVLGEQSLQSVKAQNEKAVSDAKVAGIEEGKRLGAESENARIKAIETINVPGAQKIIAEKKFDMTMTKESISTLIVEEQQKNMQALGQDRQKSGESVASQLQGLIQQSSGSASEEAEDAALIDALVSGINAGRK